MTKVLNQIGKQDGPLRDRPKLTQRVIPSEVVGVTIVSPGYEHLAQEAVSRFSHMTGLDVIVIRSRSDQSFGAKLNLDLLIAPRPIVFFDADLWMLRPFAFADLATSGQWCAVPDPCAVNPGGFPGKDTKREGWDPTTYFNSGLFACDLREPYMRQVFVDARAQLDRVHRGEADPPQDFTDQYYLNWAVHQQPEIFKPLPLHLNFFQIAVHHGDLAQIPAKITGLHAAGVQLPHKLETLRKQASVYGPPEPGIFHP